MSAADFTNPARVYGVGPVGANLHEQRLHMLG